MRYAVLDMRGLISFASTTWLAAASSCNRDTQQPYSSMHDSPIEGEIHALHSSKDLDDHQEVPTITILLPATVKPCQLTSGWFALWGEAFPIHSVAKVIAQIAGPFPYKDSLQLRRFLGGNR